MAEARSDVHSQDAASERMIATPGQPVLGVAAMANLDTPRFDPEVAHPARVYNIWLGKDHPADRKADAEVASRRPQVVAGARANRAFLACAWLATAGRPQ